jgi:ribosomal protein RSM22 (predicted rRNA methylase)
MKDAIGFRQYKISNEILAKIEAYQQKQFATVKVHEIAKAIQAQSDYYIQYPMGRTPWKEKSIQLAQIFYYLPLNFLRNLAVADEILKLYHSLSSKHVVDFGAGLGAASLAIFERLNPLSITAIEISSDATQIVKQMALSQPVNYLPELPDQIASDTIGWFSYSLTEINNPMPLFLPFDHVVIVEPSTQKDSQKLIEIRDGLIAAGYQILAPCTHQGHCPLKGNRSDWCHDKISIDLSDTMSEVESHLKWKNSDLTFSYLVASRTIPASAASKLRMIGDAQFEKGKTRQMICRGPEREFFSWLDRDKSYQAISRGALVDLPETFETKGNELRIKN